MLSWPEYVDLLKPAAELLEKTGAPQDDALRAQLWRQFVMNLSQGYFLNFQSTPEHPEFSPFENSAFLAQPNPDGVYYYAPVDGKGSYRITGERGNAPVVGFALGNRVIGMDPLPGKGLGNYDIDDLEMDQNGRFEVIFSTEKPKGYSGNWLPLPPESDFILVRQFSYDWGKEQDIRIAIERLDTPTTKPVITPEQIDKKLRHLLGGYVKNLSGISIGAVERTADSGFVNTFRLNTFQELGNGEDWPQAYFECVFELADDEALLLESELPENRPYWNVQVIDNFWNQVDFVYRQSSLNGHQAVIDGDGKFRAVLSHQDPGIHNWLDTGGNNRGMMIGRWYRCSSQPTPTLTKIKLSEVAEYLTDNTPKCSNEERADALRQRLIGAQLRRKW